MNKRIVLETYYKENFSRLCDAYKRRCDTIDNAEDVVQEAFTRALKYLDSFDSEREFERWFSLILHNAYLDWKKVERRNGMSVEFDEELMEPTEMSQTNAKIAECIRQDIERKAEPKRSILALHFLKKYKVEDIGKMKPEVSYNTMRVWVQRFKKEMRKKYG